MVIANEPRPRHRHARSTATARGSSRVVLLLSVLLAPASCAPAPARVQRPEPPAAAATVPVLLVLRALPAPAWTLTVRHESGVEQQYSGNGSEVTLSLPPGPCSLQLSCAGRTFARPLLVNVSLQVFWDLADHEGAALR
ncbi:MAG TPA: hypothetical protein VK348_13445 [Planctomycetota bacterium]|nr:hypothetical protein [Planctomycetota bacterium]